MEHLDSQFIGGAPARRRVYAGMADSGDLEVLLASGKTSHIDVAIMTSINGMNATWQVQLARVLGSHTWPAAKIAIDDFGAIPAVMRLQLEQVLEVLNALTQSRGEATSCSPIERDSFIERDVRRRATVLLGPGIFRELLDPLEQLISPWLPCQGAATQTNGGVVVVHSTLGGHPAVTPAIEGAFQSGNMSEVSGAKIVGVLELAVEDNRNGIPACAVIIFETDGMWLQEANLGLAAVAGVRAGICTLCEYGPVIGITVGVVGCFGGMSITIGLCSYLLMMRGVRLGLNGP